MPKKIGRKILLFLVVVTPVQWLVFHHYNTLLEGNTSVAVNSKAQGTSNQSTDASAKTDAFVNQLRQKHDEPVVVSSDGQYIAYVDNGTTLRVQDVKSNQQVATVTMKAPVSFLEWINNDGLFVGEKFTVNGDNRLALATVAVSTQAVKLQKTYTGLYATSNFKKIVFNPFTNDTYVLIGNTQYGQVYHFNTMNEMTLMNFSGRDITDIAVGQTSNVLYLQDWAQGTHNVLVYYNNTVSVIQRSAALLGVVNDDLYYGTLDNSGMVTQVYKYTLKTGTPAQVTQLNQPLEPSQVSVNDNGQVTTHSPTQSTNVIS